MIRKDKKKYSDGTVKTQIRVVEGYRPGPGLPPKQRTIKSFGYLEDQPNQEKFMKMVMEFDRNSRKDTMASLRWQSPYRRVLYRQRRPAGYP